MSLFGRVGDVARCPSSLSPSEIVKFREMLEHRIESRAAPLTAIPDEHKALIAKLVHERSVNYTVLLSYSCFLLNACTA